MTVKTLCKDKHSSHGLLSSQQWLYIYESTDAFFFHKRLLDIRISDLHIFFVGLFNGKCVQKKTFS